MVAIVDLTQSRARRYSKSLEHNIFPRLSYPCKRLWANEVRIHQSNITSIMPN